MKTLITKRDWLMSRKEEAVTTQGQLLLEREISSVEKELQSFVSIAGEEINLKQALEVATHVAWLRGKAKMAKNPLLAKSLLSEATSIEISLE